MTAERGVEPWRRQLYLPAYTVTDAARYSRIAPQTVTNWTHRRLSIGTAAVADGYYSQDYMLGCAYIARTVKGG